MARGRVTRQLLGTTRVGVGSPLRDVAAEIAHAFRRAVLIRASREGGFGHRAGALLPAQLADRDATAGRRAVAPGRAPMCAAACRVLPLKLGREALTLSFAISIRAKPRH